MGFCVFPFLIPWIAYFTFTLSKGGTSSIIGNSPPSRYFAAMMFGMLLGNPVVRGHTSPTLVIFPRHPICFLALWLQPSARSSYRKVCKLYSMIAFDGDKLLSAISFGFLDRCFVRSEDPDTWSFFFLLVWKFILECTSFSWHTFSCVKLRIPSTTSPILHAFSSLLCDYKFWWHNCRVDYCKGNQGYLDIQVILVLQFQEMSLIYVLMFLRYISKKL